MSETMIQQKSIETAKGKIFYWTSQTMNKRPTIVFLHGLSANHTTWSLLMQKIEAVGFNCLAPDLRGHGLSDKSKKRNLYKYSVFSGDLKKIIEQERISKIILVGYSFGGYIALDFAINNPSYVEGLILISVNHVNPFRHMRINFLTWPGYFFLNLAAWLLIWQKRKNYYYFDQADSHGYWDSSLKGYTTMPISINFWMLSETAFLDFGEQLKNLVCPTLIIKSKSDLFLSDREAQDMANKCKNSKIALLDEPTHFLASRHQEKIAELIIKFLEDRKP